STNGADYVIPTDPNNATLFRTLPTNLVTSGAGRLVLTSANTFQGATTIGQGELVLRDGGKALNTSALTVSAGAKLTLDNSVQNITNRLSDSNAITLGGGSLNFVGNASGSSEDIGPVTLASGESTIRSTTTAGGSMLVTSDNLNRSAGAFVDFVGVNSDLGTSANQIRFSPGVGDNVILAYGQVVGGAGAALAVHTTAAGVKPISATSLAGYKSSLAEVTSPTDIVRLTKSETINSAITVAALEINGDDITISGSGSITIDNGAGNAVQVMAGAYPSTATISVPVVLKGPTTGENNVEVDDGTTLVLAGGVTVFNAGSQLHKHGGGTLRLTGTNSIPATSSVQVFSGLMSVESNGALGGAGAAVVVASGATVELSGSVSLSNPLTLNGVGLSATGALLSRGANSWLGAVTLNSSASVNVIDSQLTLGGAVSGSTLTKFGVGGLVLGGGSANSSSVVVLQGGVTLAKTGVDVDAASSLTIGDDIGADDADTVSISSSVAGRQRIAG
ncbi:MAG TPA: autotransporter-associated beta strand repeat-containing protein, partial [Pirellulaceae bacterium]|nr:autotransporter-associated beta strand repeat-containing protein [Pirellulaceae bacterium]